MHPDTAMCKGLSVIHLHLFMPPIILNTFCELCSQFHVFLSSPSFFTSFSVYMVSSLRVNIT